MSQQPYNVLLIMTDQHRRDSLGCMGHPFVRTPNLDRLAEQGVLMERAYCTTPLCVPSRTTIFTGLRACHHDTAYVNRITLDGSYTHLPGVLRENGYELALVGKNHAFLDDYVATWDFCEQYDLRGKERLDFCSPLTADDERVRRWRSDPDIVPVQEGVVHEPQPSGLVADPNVSQTEHALRFLQTHDSDRPFFMYYSFESPHFPYVVPEPLFSELDLDTTPGPMGSEPLFRDKPLRLWIQYHGQSFESLTAADYQRIQATYCAQIGLVDRQIGRVLDELERTGVLEQTIVVFVSDHGDFWGHHGMVGKTNAVYEELLRVPMIWRLPHDCAPRRCPALVEVTDVMPTLLELLGLETPHAMDGRSMVGLLRGQGDTQRDRIVAEGRLNPGAALTREECKAAIAQRHQLRDAEGHGWFGPRIRGWVRSLMRADGMKVITNENDVDELYDLNVDPHESRNLAGQPAHRDLIAEMREELRTN